MPPLIFSSVMLYLGQAYQSLLQTRIPHQEDMAGNVTLLMRPDEALARRRATSLVPVVRSGFRAHVCFQWYSQSLGHERGALQQAQHHLNSSMKEATHFAVFEYDHRGIFGLSVESFWAHRINSFYRPFYQKPY